MAEVFVAAAMGEEDEAMGLAQALSLLGFDAEGGAPGEDEFAAIAQSARCILALWSPAGEDGVLTALALSAGGKLINAEIEEAVTPDAAAHAPIIALSPRERIGFKASFEALIGELKRLAPTRIETDALLEAMAHARAALLAPSPQPERPAAAAPWRMELPSWRTLGAAAAAMTALFVLGFGAGRIIRDLRSGQLLIASPTAIAAPAVEPANAPRAAPMAGQSPMQARAPTAHSAPAAATGGFNWRLLERGDWRQAAAHGLGDARNIKRRAAQGEARAQTMACLGHLAGAPGFLPSPAAARPFCDAAAAQSEPGGLYLSWVLQRTAPHAGLSAAEAQTRLAEAARLGWSAAQIDYAQMLAANGRAPLEQQAEAGRLLLAAADAGDARGQYYYARWLRDSRAGPRDPGAAAPYLERASQSGQFEAAHMLATLYRDGVGVPRNSARARALYEQAARQNYAPSMFNLADMLRNGPLQDRTRAIELYKALACLRDELQIRPLAAQRLRALQQSANCR